MGWWGGEWIENAMCEDAPCCGCCGPGSDDPAWSRDEIDFVDDDY